MSTEQTGWRWRDNELNMVDFNKLNAIAKLEYVQQIEMLEPAERSSTDEIILNRYGNKKDNNNKFFEL